MQLLMAPQVSKRLQRELRRAGRREIGGLLMGEHIADELFRVVEISVQRAGGTDARFIRRPDDHRTQLQKFLAETDNDYSRFNYLGEWHSHPSFEPTPSETDVRSMQSLVEDPEVGANFLVLLVCKRAYGGKLEATATAFRALSEPLAVSIMLEAKTGAQTPSLRQQFRTLIGF
jgi:integrative and conjugative element protein (TIGR02256 family)